MSACSGFSKCRIQFISNNPRHEQREYSERSLIEVRKQDIGRFSLRAVDIDHNKEV